MDILQQLLFFNMLSDKTIHYLEYCIECKTNPLVKIIGQLAVIELSIYWLLDDLYFIQQLI